MPIHRCGSCFSPEFRLSRVRKGDALGLMFLMYPVRCLVCLRRSFAFLPLALLNKRAPKRKMERAA